MKSMKNTQRSSSSFSAAAQSEPDFRLVIEGMMCQKNCGTTVEVSIRSVDGVKKVLVNFQQKEGLVWGDVSSEELVDAVECVGFDVTSVVDCRADCNIDESSNLINIKETKRAHDIIKQKVQESCHSTIEDSRKLSLMDVKVSGMSSTSCVRLLENSLLGISGVESVQVALLAENAEIIFDPQAISPEQVIAVILKSGYQGKVVRVRAYGNGAAKKELLFSVSGMSCANCALKVEKTLTGKVGVIEVGVSSITNKARVLIDDDVKGAVGPRDVSDLVEALGFSCELISGGGLSKTGGERDLGREDLMAWSRLLLAAVILGVPVMLLHISAMYSASVHLFVMKPAACSGGVTAGQMIMMLLNVPLQFGVGYRFYRSALLGALHGSFGMDCLVVTGTTVTFFYSCVQLTRACQTGEPTKHVFFEASGMLLMFVTFGKYLEAYAKGKTVSAITKLLEMQPSHALLVVSSDSLGRSASSANTDTDRDRNGERERENGLMSSSSAFTSIPISVSTSVSTSIQQSTSTPATSHPVPSSHNPRNYGSTSPMLPVDRIVTKEKECSDRTKNGDSPMPYQRSIPPLVSPATAASVTTPSSSSCFVTPSFGPDKRSHPNNISAGEVLKEILVDLVQKGDVLKILPGARIPTDGFILAGTAFIDESMITGESVPTLHVQGDAVFGSTVNQQSTIYVNATAIGSEGALAQIVRMVESAQMSKAPVQAYADRIAGVFTPFVLCLSLMTFVVWAMLAWMHRIPREWFADEYGDPLLFAMLFAISVVVISCPCALGLATPTAIMVGTSVGAFNGILIKGGSAFEMAHKIDTVIFDKTGTLTVGKPTVTDEVLCGQPVTGVNSISEQSRRESKINRMVRLAATAEQGSEHPLASAVLAAAKRRGLVLEQVPPSSIEIFPGCGVLCRTIEGEVLVGNREFMLSHSIPLGSIVDSSMWNIEVQGKTAVCVAFSGEVLGVLGVADVPKQEAFSAVTALRSMGLDVWMVTGDNKTTAEAIAEECNIPKDRVVSGAMPQDKVKKVKELQSMGRAVAMVGDGVNDSPALASADLGIALGAGTHVAVEAADMVLVRSNLMDVAVALDLAKVVLRRIKLNFFFALMYNVLAIPFAAGVWFPYTHMQVPPQYAGLSMAMSSISVVASSMALRFYRRPSFLETSVGKNRGEGGGEGDKDGEREGVIGVARSSGTFNSTKRRLDVWSTAWFRDVFGGRRGGYGGAKYSPLSSNENGYLEEGMSETGLMIPQDRDRERE